MSGKNTGWVVALVLAAGWLTPANAHGWPFFFGHSDHDCPPPSYSCWNYWAPNLLRQHDWHRPLTYIYAVNRFPDIPYGYDIHTFPCPAVEPAALYASGPYGRAAGTSPEGEAAPATPSGAKSDGDQTPTPGPAKQ
jgi:hypothetical protein